MRAVPDSIQPLIDFLNTIDVEDGTDVFRGGPRGLAKWLVEQRLCEVTPAVTTAHVHAAIDLRRGLRSLALANAGEPADSEDVRAAQEVLTALSFTMRLPADAGTVQREPTLRVRSGTIPDALGKIAIAYFVATVGGEWSRVRRCPAPDCAWVFWDSSKNASRRWCSMRACGNRAKARAFAKRRGTSNG